jgi:outer membrane protein TolC
MKRAILATVCLGSLLHAQEQPVSIQAAHVPAIIRPYLAPTTPPIHLHNSSRMANLMRAGNLYLTVADAIALAIENNLNLEIDRYGPLLADSALERSKAGGPLRGVPAGNSQISSVNSGIGVNGSIASAGLSGGSGGGGGTSGNGGATIQQVGAVVPNFDATFQNTSSFSHLSYPQANTTVAQTDVLVQSSHTYNNLLTQGLLTGGSIQYREYQQTLGENAPGDWVNPSSSVRMDLIVRQPLLQSFGTRLNDRTIRIAHINTTAAREQFRAQLLDLTASVLNLYYGLVAANDEWKSRQLALEIAQKFLSDTNKEIAAEAIPPIQRPRAEAEVSQRSQELLIAQAAVRQQEILLKEAISHTEDPALESAGIVLVDRLQVPDSDDLPPLRELLNTAMSKRPDVAVSKYRDQTSDIDLAGTTNPLLPTLNATLQTFNRGTGGVGHTVDGTLPNGKFVGGYGTAFAQTLSRDFPNEAATVSGSAPFGNRFAQAEYGIAQLQYRQSQVSSQKDLNAIVVDVAARVAALRQAHSRFDAARDTRILQEQLLAADRQRFTSGGGNTTFDAVMADQRALVNAQISEVNAGATYAHARTALDQTLGETLEKNNITLEEGLSGHVERQSQIPAVLDAGKK